MENEVKNHYEIVILAIQAGIGIFQLIFLFASAYWGYLRFRVEKKDNPRIDFDIEANFLGPQKGYYVTQVSLKIANKGLLSREFKEFKLRLRGISKDMEIEEWESQKPRLLLPDEIIDTDNVVSDKFNFIFVEPGVCQELTYFTRVPEKYRFISIYAQFDYDRQTSHSAERLFEIKE